MSFSCLEREREPCLCSFIGICLKNNKKKKKGGGRRKHKRDCAVECGRVFHTEPSGQPLSNKATGVFHCASSHDLFTFALMVRSFFTPALHIVTDTVCTETVVPAAFWIAEFPCKRYVAILYVFDMQPK